MYQRLKTSAMSCGVRLVNSAVALLLLIGSWQLVSYLDLNLQEVIVTDVMIGGWQPCPPGRWGESCDCMLGYKSEENLDHSSNSTAAPKGNCTLVPCPDNADGAPACRCKEGYEGSVAFNVDSQQWQGTCEKGAESNIRVCLTVLTFNRPEYVEMQSLSLKAQSEPLPWGSLLKLWVFDDQSTAYGENELRQWYPMAEQITINDHSLADYGAANTIRGLEELLKNPECDVIVTADSDLVFHPKWYKNLIRAIPKSDGVISLYNSCSHKLLYCGDGLCQKMDVGNAGCAFTRDALTDILANVVKNRAFDWNYSKYFTQTKGKTLYALSPSMVEHMGAHGSNGPDSAAERSIDFPYDELDEGLRGTVISAMSVRPACNLVALAAKPPVW